MKFRIKLPTSACEQDILLTQALLGGAQAGAGPEVVNSSPLDSKVVTCLAFPTFSFHVSCCRVSTHDREGTALYRLST